MTDTITPYDASSIQVLEGLEAVRRRPGMYIGSTDIRGLHHLVYEIVDNSVDEALAGYCDHIVITIHPDCSVTVQDDGRGVPVDVHPKLGRSALEVIMTVLHAGGKFGGGGYKVSGGLHGVGASVVNALSDWVVVEVRKEGNVYRQRYEQGVPVTPVEVIGETTLDDHGTTTTFHPDPAIFHSLDYSFDVLVQRFREVAYLTKGLSITFIDERDDREMSFFFDGGIVSFVRQLNRNRQPLHPRPFYVCREAGDCLVELALQYTDGYGETTLTFANNINTVDGGTHLTGFKSALTRTINDYARRNGFLKESDENLSGEDVREGLTAVVSVKLAEPQFEGQTKGKLGNAEVAGAVQTVVNEALGVYLNENPQVAKRIVEKCVMAARAREPAGSASVASMAALTSGTDTGLQNRTSSACRISRCCGISETTSGHPIAMASRTVFGLPSNRLSDTSTSALFIQASSSFVWPNIPIRSRASQRCTRSSNSSRSGPSPKMIATARGRDLKTPSSASMSVPTFFSLPRRPAYRMIWAPGGRPRLSVSTLGRLRCSWGATTFLTTSILAPGSALRQ